MPEPSRPRTSARHRPVPGGRRPVPASASAVALGLALVLVAGSPVAAFEPWRPADVGEWRVVWSVSEAIGLRNDFPELGLEMDFPLRWRLLEDSRGRRLAIFDALGEVAREIPIGSDERAIASADGSVVVRWSDDPVDLDLRHVSYWRADGEAPDWEASVRGEPCLLAPDGGVLVLTSARVGEDGAPVMLPDDGGRLQVVGAGGEVREELDFAPLRTALTPDQRTILLLRPGELVALGRDGTLAWSVPLPIDDVPSRSGLRPLACADGLVAIAGTAGVRDRYRGGLQIDRRGRVQVRADGGKLLWERRQGDDEDRWFEPSVHLSPDGSRLAMIRSGARGLHLALHDARTGEMAWERLHPRRLGFRTLSMNRDGTRIAVAHTTAQSQVLVRDGTGETVFEGLLPLDARRVTLVDGDLLVAERWIAQLRPAERPGPPPATPEETPPPLLPPEEEASAADQSPG